MRIDNFNMIVKGKTYRVNVPFSMYSALLENKDIKHPYYDGKEEEIRDLSYQDIECFSVFNVDDAILNKKNIILNFYGIDTIADIYLNNTLLGHTENMHRLFTFDVKKHLKSKENLLFIKIYSPIKFIEKKQKEYPLSGFNAWALGFAHLRKSNCSFGWDWGPQLPDMGIFRKVEIESYDDIVLKETEIKQKHSENRVVLSFESEIECDKEFSYKIEVVSPNNQIYEFKNQNTNKAEITIENPLLWWVNNLGEQPLYDVKITVETASELKEKSFKIGIREFKVLNSSDKYGKEFTFQINGKKFFSMGGNYIPEDLILAFATREKTSKLLSVLKKANFNTIRVWGGGYYSEDYFYSECDRLGLIVWQDIMYACTTVYFDDEIRQNLEKELEYNIKRIRNHASMGLICGNNEIEMLFADWTYLPRTKKDEEMYLELFEKFIPELCKKYAEHLFYLPSSPTSDGKFVKPNDVNLGDSHFWDVWHGLKPFEEYGKHLFRFCSEFGFESFPSIKTVKTYAKGKQLNPFSETMENHQKCKDGNMRIIFHSSQNYIYPTTIENFIYVSQLIQADAIKYGVEHMRRNRGICMGAIYWQINDCWPVSSWSSIDYFGRWKALHYAAKKFYAPVLLSINTLSDRAIINVSNETLQDFNGVIEYALCDNKNNVIKKESKEIFVKALSAEGIEVFEKIKDKKQNYLAANLLSENKIIQNALSLFIKPKKYLFKKPEFNIVFEKENQKTFLNIMSDVFAKSVEIDFLENDFVLSDNYFDITAIGGIKKIEIENCDLSIEELRRQLKIRSVYDIS